MAGLEGVARYWGIHPALLPQRHYAVFARAGIDPADLRRTLRRIHSMDEWPTVWKAEGERHETQGHDLAAFLCMYLGQRVVIDPGERKSELYARAAAIYRALPHTYPIQALQMPHGCGKVALYVQQPRRRCLGTVLLVPGVTFAKEELHFAAQTFLARGWRVVRIDNPVYGETEGTIQDLGIDYIASLAGLLRSRYSGPLHGIGFSLGGFLLLKNSAALDRVVTIGAPCDPDRCLDQLPEHSLRALSHMIGSSDIDELRHLLRAHRVRPDDIAQTPLLLVHGGRDRTIPLSEMAQIAARSRGPALTLTYSRESHGCMGSLEEIWAECLEWFLVAPSDRRPLQVMQVEPSLLRTLVAQVRAVRGRASVWPGHAARRAVRVASDHQLAQRARSVVSLAPAVSGRRARSS